MSFKDSLMLVTVKQELVSKFRGLSISTQYMGVFIILCISFFLTIFLTKYKLIHRELLQHVNFDIKFELEYSVLAKGKVIKEELIKKNVKQSLDRYYDDITLTKFIYLHFNSSSLKFLSTSYEQELFTQYQAEQLDTHMNFELFIGNDFETKANISRSFIPYYFNIIPLFVKFGLMEGLTFNNFYYIDSINGVDKYFKYPVPKKEDAQENSNINVKDSFLDPVIDSLLPNLVDNDVTYSKADEIKANNWYNKVTTYLDDKADDRADDKTDYISLFKSVQLLKKGYNLQIENYLVNYVASNILNTRYSDKPFNVMFGNVIDLNLQSNYRVDNLTEDRLITGIVYNDSIKRVYINETDENTIFYNDYNIDDNNFLMISFPQFLVNLFYYTFSFHQLDKQIDENTVIMSIDILKNIKNYTNFNITINNDFLNDAYFLQLVPFFLNYRSYQLDNTSSIIDLYHHKDKSLCYFSNISLYLTETRHSILSVDEDLCSLFDCKINSVTNYSSLYYHSPSCYDLPLKCPNDVSMNTSNYFKELPECQAQFTKFKEYVKSSDSYNYTFKVNSEEFPNNFTSFNYFILYMSSQVGMEEIIYDLLQDLLQIEFFIIVGYYIICTVIILFLILMVNKQLQNFKAKIEMTKQINKKILLCSRVTVEEDEDQTENLKDDSDVDSEESNSLVNENSKPLPVAKEGNSAKHEQSKLDEIRKLNFSTPEQKKSTTLINKNEEDQSHKKHGEEEKEGTQAKDSNKTSQNLKNIEKKQNKAEKDELEEVYNIIYDNIEEFTMDFDINKNIYLESPLILNYTQFINKKLYSNAIIIPEKKRRGNFSIDDNTNEANEDDNTPNSDSASFTNNNEVDFNSNKHLMKSNFSIRVLSELLSTEYIDVGSYNKNFYFRERDQAPIINLYDFINTYLTNDETYVNEILDPEKLAIAVDYIGYEIIDKWMKNYGDCLEEEEF